MRISDWSSDVCSSDLLDPDSQALHNWLQQETSRVFWPKPRILRAVPRGTLASRRKACTGRLCPTLSTSRRSSCCLPAPRSATPRRTRSEESRVGKECSVRVDLGGRRLIKKKKKKKKK